MNTADIMTRRLITVTPSTSVGEAARLMLEYRVSGLPVVDDVGALVGLITEADLLRRAETGTERHLSWWRALVLGTERVADQYVRSHGRRVEEIMTRSIVSVAPSTPLVEAVSLMEARSVKRLLILDGERLVGIVSRADLVRALGQSLEKSGAGLSAASSDAAIRRRILAELERQRWVPAALIDVKVSNGVVELCGLILSEGQRNALRVLAENTPEVTAVVDKLVWIEPYTGIVLQVPPEESKAVTSSARASEC